LSNNPYADLGAIPVNDYSDLGAVPVQQNTQQSQQEPGMFSRIGADVAQRQKQAEQIGTNLANQLHTATPIQKVGLVGQAALQGLGTAAGALLDTSGEAAKSVISTAAGGIDKIGNFIHSTGQSLGLNIPIQNASQSTKIEIAKGLHTIANTDVGKVGMQAINSGIDAWKGFKKNYPNAAKDIESVINVGLLLYPARGKDVGPSMLGESGQAFSDLAKSQAKAKTNKNLFDIIRPIPTGKQAIENVKQTIESKRLGIKTLKPTNQEKQIVEAVKSIPDIGKGSFQRNFNAISQYNRQLSDKLQTKLENSQFLIPHQKTLSNIQTAADDLIQKNPIIVGDMQKTAERVIAKAMDFVTANDPTPAGLYKARKQFDQFMLDVKGKGIFDPTRENALTQITRTIRQSMNNTIDGYLPNGTVKNTFRKQTLLFDAMENIAPKASQEGNNIVSRLLHNVAKVIGVRNEFVAALATATGAGGLGAAAKFAPLVTETLSAVIGGFGLYKLAKSPQSKEALGMLLKGADRAIITSKNPSMVKQLRMDRAYVADLLKNSQQEQQ